LTQSNIRSCRWGAAGERPLLPMCVSVCLCHVVRRVVSQDVPAGRVHHDRREPSSTHGRRSADQLGCLQASRSTSRCSCWRMRPRPRTVSRGAVPSIVLAEELPRVRHEIAGVLTAATSFASDRIC
jgi:hypothetical protein